ncbi:MAG: hemerythrin domain-containing protein [Flavobacteriaceae bacterium]|nr:hemerythrin domain-containing protein [Flavobacteriaceae bacterium]
MKQNPQKRDKALQPLSRDHHHGLLLCWKIREGFKRNIEVNRIKLYIDWFYKEHLLPHFEVEEKYVFTILGNENELTNRAIAEHRRLKRLFESSTEIQGNLSLIEEELESHIRFEERILFSEIQNIATDEQLSEIQINHSDTKFADNLTDPFWE